jgi:hypothetical protein
MRVLVFLHPSRSAPLSGMVCLRYQCAGLGCWGWNHAVLVLAMLNGEWKFAAVASGYPERQAALDQEVATNPTT